MGSLSSMPERSGRRGRSTLLFLLSQRFRRLTMAATTVPMAMKEAAVERFRSARFTSFLRTLTIASNSPWTLSRLFFGTLSHRRKPSRGAPPLITPLTSLHQLVTAAMVATRTRSTMALPTQPLGRCSTSGLRKGRLTLRSAVYTRPSSPIQSLLPQAHATVAMMSLAHPTTVLFRQRGRAASRPRSGCGTHGTLPILIAS